MRLSRRWGIYFEWQWLMKLTANKTAAELGNIGATLRQHTVVDLSGHVG